MATEIKPKYSAQTDITITLAGLGSSASKVLGRESTAIDNTTTRYRDVLLSGKFTTGDTPTVDTTIDVWVYSSKGDGPNYPDVLDGTDSNETFGSVYQRDSCMKLVTTMMVDATGNTTYEYVNVPVAPHFGGVMPKYWGLWITHNTATPANATASFFSTSFVGITDEIVTT